MKQNFLNQYNAVFSMLKKCIEQYDEYLWVDSEKFTNSAWHISYHVIFFANIYCCSQEKDILSWSVESENYQILGKTPWPPHEKIELKRSYTKNEMLQYLNHVTESVPGYLETFEADKDCWPFWYDLSQFEFQLNSLRHIQHHTAQLLERQNAHKKISVGWETFKNDV